MSHVHSVLGRVIRPVAAAVVPHVHVVLALRVIRLAVFRVSRQKGGVTQTALEARAAPRRRHNHALHCLFPKGAGRGRFTCICGCASILFRM